MGLVYLSESAVALSVCHGNKMAAPCTLQCKVIIPEHTNKQDLTKSGARIAHPSLRIGTVPFAIWCNKVCTSKI